MSKPTSDRVERASAGIESGVIDITERLREDAPTLDADLRLLEALLFAAAEPIDIATLRDRMGEGVDVAALLSRLARDYAGRGINLVHVADRWRFQTASDLAHHLTDIREAPRKLSRAALETLSIIAYHQPVTRSEIEDVRGVAVSRRTLGRPVTYGTSEGFLAHFNIESLDDLPGRDDLKAAGLLDPRLPKDFEMPTPTDADLEGDFDLDPMDEVDSPNFFEDFLDGEDESEG